MMKSSELLLIVDSVEEAVKFYTEKLAFDVANLEASKENPHVLAAAHLRKGKCFISFKTPQVEELAEFSFIKRCVSRCVGLRVEMKKGIEKYFQRNQKKGLRVIAELKESDGVKSFAIRDPFGVKLIFVQPVEDKVHVSSDVAGKIVEMRGRKEADVVNELVEHLRAFGILRRAAKKYAKLKVKQLTPKMK
jgi:catechol 2,3-dioxygenase-like lactoylglutathione lyase family enzyme